MQRTDERILEGLRDEGNATAEMLEDMGACAAGTAHQRLPKLTEYGLAQRVATGVYRITDEGKAFLNEDLDADDLEPVDDS